MKVVHYLPYSYHIHTGGLEKIAQTVADGLSRNHGVENLIFASDIRRGSGEDLEKYTDTIFVPSFDLVYNFPFPKFWKKSYWQHFQQIKAFHPEVVVTHTRFFLQSFIWGLIAKKYKAKRVHVEHGSGFLTGYPRYIRFFAWLFDWTLGLWIFRQSDEVVTISQMHQQFISKFTSKKPHVIYNPVEYQSQKKIKNQTPHIGFIGRLVPLKGVDLLIRALDELKGLEWSCTIVGEWSEWEKLKNLVSELWLADRISFVGADDRDHRLHKFDVFINPSYQEGLPTTVVEALLAQSIVVATDVWGTNEISDQKDLILVQPGEVEGIKAGILQALEVLDQSGASLELVQERFGVEEAVEKYFSVFKI